ncbi:WD40-repeat-containing domain protein [Syncephalis plumigaleata]|nr:WD40-repeat-containing domain protein [Syncephalis plumigaleata]
MVEVTKQGGSGKRNKKQQQQKQKDKRTKRQKTETTTTSEDLRSVTKKNEATSSTTATPTEPNTVDHSYFRVVTGSYERLLYGIDVYWNDANEEDKTSSSRLQFKPVFAFPAHIGCLKAVGAGGNYLATGSTDELIKLYDLKNRKELGTLMHHDGTITTLAFFNKTHMISTGEDGKLCIWRTKDWECLRVLKGHTGAIHCADVHPTGRVALSVGADRTLRSWDLTIGGKLTSTKLRQAGNIVRWSPSAVVSGRNIDIYNTADAKVCRTFTTRTTLHCDELLVVGGDDKRLRIYHADKDKPLCEMEAHNARIKDLAILPSASNDHPTVVITISSSGQIRVWDLAQLLTSSTASDALLGEYDTESRLTCALAVHGFIKS